MRVTRKGQVTIPIEIRRQLGIDVDPEVAFEVVGGILQLRPVSTARPVRILRRLLEARYTGPSTEELMALTRGDP